MDVLPSVRLSSNFRSWRELTEQVKGDLGCGDTPVEAELYKLLIYGKGGHFAAHRDTEKAGGMFGTLVITLPSAHEGGTLLVRHAGKEVALDLCPHESAEIRHAAFYADCEHEVLPVTDGYRICLVYNLVRAEEGEPLAPADDRVARREAAQALRTWAKRVWDEDPPTHKIVYLLSHKYTEASLSFQSLKGGDAVLARVLGEAADASDFELHLAMVHIGDYGYFDGWYGYGDEPDEGDMDDAVVDDSRARLSGWRDRSDQPVDFSSMDLDPGRELLPHGALDGEPPDEINFHASTGNEGASFDRAYLRAALVLWPKDNAIPIALEGGPGVMTALLRHRAAQGAPEDPEALEILADRILESLQEQKHYNLEWVPDFIDALKTLGFTDALRAFWESALLERYRGRWNESMAASLDGNLPPPIFTPDFLVAFTDRVHDRPFSEELLTAMAANPKVFSVETLLEPAWALSLERETDPGTRAMLWRLCATALLRRSEYPPPAPTDWVDPTPVPENSGTAKELLRFLRDPDAQHFAYRAAQHLRSEMENLIRHHRLDLDTRTEKKGSPHTLHLTKNRASYHKAVKIHREDVQRMKALLTPPGRIPPGTSDLAERCRLAAER